MLKPPPMLAHSPLTSHCSFPFFLRDPSLYLHSHLVKSITFIHLLDIGWRALSDHDVPDGRAEPERSTVHSLKSWGLS